MKIDSLLIVVFSFLVMPVCYGPNEVYGPKPLRRSSTGQRETYGPQPLPPESRRPAVVAPLINDADIWPAPGVPAPARGGLSALPGTVPAVAYDPLPPSSQARPLASVSGTIDDAARPARPQAEAVASDAPVGGEVALPEEGFFLPPGADVLDSADLPPRGSSVAPRQLADRDSSGQDGLEFRQAMGDGEEGEADESSGSSRYTYGPTTSTSSTGTSYGRTTNTSLSTDSSGRTAWTGTISGSASMQSGAPSGADGETSTTSLSGSKSQGTQWNDEY